MKKLVLLIVLALAAGVAYVAMAGGGADASGIRITHYKCYQARHAKGATRFIPQTVFLTDQFRDNVEMSVIKLNTHCSQAIQDPISTPRAPGGSAAGFDPGLNCYTIRDAPRQERFRPQNVHVLDKFTEQTLTVSKAQSLCVPSFKDTKFTGTLERNAFICYQAKTAKGQPRFQQRNISMRDQFAEKLVRVLRPVAYCAPTEKKIDARNDDFDSATDVTDLPNLSNGFEDHSSTINSTLAPDDPNITCKDRYSNSVWYSWKDSSNFSVTIDTSDSSYQTVVAVFEDNDPDPENVDLKPVACNRSTTQFDATADKQYYILVGSSDGQGGKLKFRASVKTDAPDLCVNGATLTQLSFVGQSDLIHRSTMNAGPNVAGGCPQADAPACGTKAPEHTVWFLYVPPAGQTQKIRFDASASSYDTLVAVFNPSGTLVVCGNGSVNASPLLSGQIYHVMVGDVDPNREGGKLKLRWRLEGFIPAGSQAGVGIQGPGNNSLTCYQVRQARHRPENQSIFDQFSIRQLPEEVPWTLTIGGVDSICVPSTKETCTRYIDALAPDGDLASLCITN